MSTKVAVTTIAITATPWATRRARNARTTQFGVVRSPIRSRSIR